MDGPKDNARLPRRFLIGSVLLGLFVLFDVALFGWLLFRALSEREISRILLETREEAEGLAEQLAGRAREQGQDLFLAVATERETQIYIDQVLHQRQLVREVEIRDRDGNLVYKSETKETVPVGGDQIVVESPETGPHYEERQVEHRETFEVGDLTVPIGELGEIHIGLSQEELQRRVGALRAELMRQAAVVGVVTLACLLAAYWVIWRLVKRSRALEAQAADAERMAYVGTLAAGLAHEIRNPLNSLNLNMQMLEEDLPGSDAGGPTGRLLSITRSELARLERLVSDFLAYAKPRAPEREVTRAAAPLQRAAEILRAQAQSRAVRILVEDRAQESWISADPQQLHQLFLNLAQNAIHATEGVSRDPRVILRVREEDGDVVYEVEDNGIGIPPHELDRIHDVFYSTRKGGTGLGLAVVRRIAQSHEGRLEIESEPGRGTVARVVLAATAAPDGDPVSNRSPTRVVS